jgi:flagellar basal-body rod protein FlgG
MLTQQRNLDVVANNMTNISTAGYKTDKYTATTFDQVVYSRLSDGTYTNLGSQSYIRATDQIYTDFTQGTPEATGLTLDFAIYGDGFFAVQSQTDGQVSYTRSGSFSLDEQGYLCLDGYGRVLDSGGQTIQLGTDKVYGDNYGNIFDESSDQFLGTLGVFSFADTGALVHTDDGLFTGEGATLDTTSQVYWGYLERSNVDMTKQMTEMLTCQRAFQSAATVTKLYDELTTKATTELARM